MDITYTQMRYFTEVCRQGNLTRAAEVLHVAQPSLSVAIKKMEIQFDCALFYRQKGRLILTQEGEYFLRKCSEILKSVDDLNLDMLDRSASMKKLRIGVSSIAAFVFARAYMEFIEAHPDVQIEIMEVNSVDMESLLLRDSFDIGVGMITDLIESKYDTEILGQFPLVFCVKRGHPLAGRKSIRVEDLADQPIVMASPQQFHSTAFIRELYAKAGIAPKVVLNTSQSLTSTSYNRQFGTGSFEVNEFVKDMPDMVAIPLDPAISMKIGLIRHRGALPRSTTLQFIEHLRKFRRPAP